MSSVQHLREFIRERLTAAAQEIFTEVEKTIICYEEELDAQRRMMGIDWKPQIKLHRVGSELQRQSSDFQKPHDSMEEEGFALPRVFNQERKSSRDQVKAEHRQIIKEEEPEPTITEQWGEPEIKWTKDMEDPEFPLINKEQEEPDFSLFVEKHKPYYLLTTQDQNYLNGSQYGEQFVALMETPTPQTEQISFQISPVSDTQSHPYTKKKSFKCDICGKFCKYQSDLKVHYRTHTGERPFPCQTCGKHFSHISNLNFHIRIHTGEKPFSCQTCGKKFTHMSTLIVHKKIHTGERPFSCKTCGKSFKRIHHLTVHQVIHTGERPFPCETCGKYFARRADLNIHRQTHTSEKPFSCQMCGKKFTCMKNLNLHTKLHTGERPFSCETCGKSFIRNAGLKVHRQKHSGEKPLLCQICGKSFIHVGKLKFHMNQKHKSESLSVDSQIYC